MWRLLRTPLLRRFTSPSFSYVSDSESFLRDVSDRVALTPSLRGVVVRHLPQQDDLESTLGQWLGTTKDHVKVLYTVEGKPAYGVVNLNSEKEIEQAAAKNKARIGTSKVFVTRLPDFINENRPIAGGFDSRRVVVSFIDPFWNEAHLMKVLSPLGDVMGLYLPRDYDFPYNLEGIGIPLVKELPEKFMTFRKVNLEWTDYVEEGTLREDASDTARSSHFLTRAYEYFSNEFGYLSSTLQTSSSLDIFSQTINEVCDLWCFIRALKDQIYHKPDAAEAAIDDLVNDLIQKPSQNKAYDVLLQIRTHGLNFLHSYFQNRGYAYVTFATRKQAERAIACSNVITSEGKEVHICFHRNEPGFKFNSGKISEAILEAIETYADKGHLYEEEKEASMLARAVFPIDAHFTRLRAHYKFMGESGDPVLEDRESSFATALNTQAKINAIKLPNVAVDSDFKKELTKKEYMLSSDEEYFDDEDEVGRVKEGASEKAQEGVINRLFPSDEYAISALPSFEDNTHPSPSLVSKQVAEIQRFFSEAIPSVYKDKPHLLKTQRYGDHPQVRYVCSEPFDYSTPPKPKAFRDPAEKRKYVRTQIRNFILSQCFTNPTKPASEAIQPPIDPSPEEDRIHQNPEKFLSFTDSDDEKEYAHAVVADPDVKKDEDNNENEELKMEEKNMIEDEDEQKTTIEDINILLSQSAFSASKRILYTGDDLDNYMKGLQTKYPQLLFTCEKTEQGEQYVIATLVKNHLFDVKEVMELSEKYEKQMLAGTEELDIDPQDQPLFEKLAKLKHHDPQEIATDLVEQLANHEIKQHLDTIIPTVEEMKGVKELSLDEFVKEFRRRRDESFR